MKAYYNLIDDCKDFPEWTRKIEEELGQDISLIATTFDESDRNAFVAKSKYFQRFVSYYSNHSLLIGPREAKILQVSKKERITDFIYLSLFK